MKRKALKHSPTWLNPFKRPHKTTNSCFTDMSSKPRGSHYQTKVVSESVVMFVIGFLHTGNANNEFSVKTVWVLLPRMCEKETQISQNAWWRNKCTRGSVRQCSKRLIMARYSARNMDLCQKQWHLFYIRSSKMCEEAKQSAFSPFLIHTAWFVLFCTAHSVDAMWRSLSPWKRLEMLKSRIDISAV